MHKSRMRLMRNLSNMAIIGHGARRLADVPIAHDSTVGVKLGDKNEFK
jgi:hypothetical protein